MQVRNLYCVQCVHIIVARMGSQRESGDTLLMTTENLKLSKRITVLQLAGTINLIYVEVRMSIFRDQLLSL